MAQKSAQIPRPTAAPDLEFPVDNQKVVVKNYDAAFMTAAIKVQVRSSDTNRMVAIIRDHPYEDPMPPTLPAVGELAGYTELGKDEHDPDLFVHDTVPIFGLPGVSPTDRNKKLFVAGYDAGHNRIADSVKSIRFWAFPEVFPVVVDARSCLWLAFAANEAVLPLGEKPPEYRPIDLFVPAKNAMNTNITRVELRARNDDRWQKGPSLTLKFDADGDATDVAGLANDGYRTADHANANNIAGDNLPKAKLVALWQEEGSLVATELPVGKAGPALVIPTSTNPIIKLHLGFHDGTEWTNNTGRQVVLVRWLTA